MTNENAFDEGDFDSSLDAPVRQSVTSNVLTIACDIVVSSRVRLARNIADFPFLDACSDEQRGQIESAVQAVLLNCRELSELTVVDCQQLELLEHQFLADLQAVIGIRCRNLSTVNQIKQAGPSKQPIKSSPERGGKSSVGKGVNDGVEREIEGSHRVADAPNLRNAFAHSKQTTLILNGEDHLKIQVQMLGLNLRNAWSTADQIDDAIEHKLNFAFNPQWGYLTACPANVGTGLCASVVLHLPALVASGKIHDVLKRWGRFNVVGREVFGDPAGGDFYRFSNQATLGYPEPELIEQVNKSIPEIVAAERRARRLWLAADRDQLHGETSTALKNLLKLDFTDQSEANLFDLVRQLSRVRLGLEMGLLTHSEVAPVAGEFELIHLREQLQQAISQEEYGRASGLRDRIQFLSGDSA